MDTATLLAVLRRVAQAQPGPNALQLPSDVSPHAAIRAIEAAITALEPAPTPRPRTRAAPTGMRVHIDGASRGNPGPAGIGVVFVAPDGTVAERLHRGIGTATNNVAEYSALIVALERAAAMGIQDLEVYSDSELLVRQLEGRYQVKHPTLRPLYARAKERMAAFRHVAIHHVPRELNAEADALANSGIDQARGPGVRKKPRVQGERE